MDTLTQNARALRRGMTKEERHLWYDFLRTYPIRFMRQRPIGSYIVDFYCARARLVVELDGDSTLMTPEELPTRSGTARCPPTGSWSSGSQTTRSTRIFPECANTSTGW